MDMFRKITVITFLVLGAAWWIVGICLSYSNLATTEYRKSPNVSAALVSLVACASVAALCWFLSASLHLAGQWYTTFHAWAVTQRPHRV